MAEAARLLREMGVTVYALRSRIAANAPLGAAELPVAAPTSARSVTAATASSVAPDVLLIADAPGGRIPKFVGDVERALRALGINAGARAAATLVDGELNAARGLVVLGPAHARALGARLPAHVQSALAMVVCDALPALARGTNGKRALWGELKRLRRELIARTS